MLPTLSPSAKRSPGQPYSSCKNRFSRYRHLFINPNPEVLPKELAEELYEVGARPGHYQAFLSLLRQVFDLSFPQSGLRTYETGGILQCSKDAAQLVLAIRPPNHAGFYQQTFIDTYTKVSFAKLYDKTPSRRPIYS
jgi:hypothetical protein